MRKCSYYIILFLFIAIACQDNMDINTLQSKSQPVVYCFPTTDDTTKIYISSSIPIKGSRINLDSAYISFESNGRSEIVHFLKKIESNKLYKLAYYAVGTHQVGYNISLKVTIKNFPEISATTTIPATPEVQNIDIDTVSNSDKIYDQIRVKLKSKQLKDYFAVRIIGLETIYNKDKDSTFYYLHTQEIDTRDEPLLNNFAKGETAINTDNVFYNNFYIFDNSAFATDSTYTLHLNIQSKSYVSRYKVQLYHITPEFYRFIKSINDIRNNEMGNYGMSFVQPSYTNIINGIGVVGGYSMKESKWLFPKRKI